jgi:hypothetical protein
MAVATGTGRSVTADVLAGLLRSARFRYSSEDDLQRGIVQFLEAMAVPFEREVVLAPASRIDFLVGGSIGIEVKIGGSVADLGYQVLRYLQQERVASIIVVTTKASHRDLPPELEGKKIYIVHLYTSAF